MLKHLNLNVGLTKTVPQSWLALKTLVKTHVKLMILVKVIKNVLFMIHRMGKRVCHVSALQVTLPTTIITVKRVKLLI